MPVAELEIDLRPRFCLHFWSQLFSQTSVGDDACLMASAESYGLGIECIYVSHEETSGNGKYHLYELSRFSSLICRPLPLAKP